MGGIRKWSDNEDKIALYLSKYGAEKKFVNELLGLYLGMGYNSFSMRVLNYVHVAGGKGLEGAAKRCYELYEQYKDVPQQQFKDEVLTILTNYHAREAESSPKSSEEQCEEEQLFHLDLVALMSDLRERNKLLPFEQRLPVSYFSVYMRAIGSWYNIVDLLGATKITYEMWQDNYGYNDLHYLSRFKLSEEEQAIIAQYINWAKKIEKTIK